MKRVHVVKMELNAMIQLDIALIRKKRARRNLRPTLESYLAPLARNSCVKNLVRFELLPDLQKLALVCHVFRVVFACCPCLKVSAGKALSYKTRPGSNKHVYFVPSESEVLRLQTHSGARKGGAASSMLRDISPRSWQHTMPLRHRARQQLLAS